jgi:NAD(P)-dependent dehydrogenase (short-subunit alcohol dehydrogenase family)
MQCEVFASSSSVNSHPARSLPRRSQGSGLVKGLFEQIEQNFGGLDILICNAASTVFDPALAIDERGWR